MSAENEVIEVQTAVASLLEADSVVGAVAVIQERRGTPESDAKAALETRLQKAGKSGAAVVVGMPVLTLAGSEAPGPFLTATVPVRILVRPRMAAGPAGVQVTVEELTTRALQTLHLMMWKTGQTLTVDAPGASPVEDLPEGTVGYDLAVSTKLQLVPLSRMPGVTITQANGEVTLTCTDATALIRYTMNDSWPGPEATQYTSALTATAGVTVRAVAYPAVATKRPSHIAEKTLS
jgi:hypothetical protein